MVQDVNMGSSTKRDTEAQLIDRVEEAQVCWFENSYIYIYIYIYILQRKERFIIHFQ